VEFPMACVDGLEVFLFVGCISFFSAASCI
jgi:hypothetical protein